MDGDPGSIRGSLIEKLSQKASLSQKVFDNTFSVFGRLKEVLHEMSSASERDFLPLDRDRHGR